LKEGNLTFIVIIQRAAKIST